MIEWFGDRGWEAEHELFVSEKSILDYRSLIPERRCKNFDPQNLDIFGQWKIDISHQGGYFFFIFIKSII